MSEADYTTTCIQLAKLHGWLVHHDVPAWDKREKKPRTHLHPDADPGFPDLCLARDGEVLFVELKTKSGTVSPEQRRWLAATGGRVVRPADWDEFKRLVSKPRPPRDQRKH